MRAFLVCLLLVAAPMAARADLTLSLGANLLQPASASLLGSSDSASPSAHLLPELSVDRELGLLAQGSGGTLTGGMRSGERQVLALLLGIIPGFGIGHVVAGSSDWPIWLIVDVVLFVFVGWGFWWGPWWHGAEGLGVLIFLIERGFEGYFAYRAAGGRPIATRDALPEGNAVAALPKPGMNGFSLAF